MKWALSEDQFPDFEVMALQGDPVVAFTSSPIELLADPADLAVLIYEARKLGGERGHTFDRT